MFLTLLRKECAQYLKSIIYYVFVAWLVVDFVMQMGTFEPVLKPKAGQEDYSQYGGVPTRDKEVIMQAALDELLFEYEIAEYPTYPFGFYKKFIPNDKENKKIQELILKMTDYTAEELKTAYEDYNAKTQEMLNLLGEGGNSQAMEVKDIPPMSIPVTEGYSYDTFLKDMEWLDDLLGGGSSYSRENIENDYVMQSPTYEQACEIYDDFIDRDKVTAAYARLFCDYEGITLAAVTVFLAVTRALRDRRAQAEQVIYARRISSLKLMLSRYLAGVVMTLIPVFALSCIVMVQSVYYAKRLGVECDYFAFIKYILFWLLPTILVTLSLGFFLTEFTDSAIAILVQIAWWFISLYSMSSLVGCTRFNLIPRFNSVVGYKIYVQMKEILLWNRCFYTMLAVFFFLLTVWVYDWKRKGVFVSVGARLRNRKNKLEA